MKGSYSTHCKICLLTFFHKRKRQNTEQRKKKTEVYLVAKKSDSAIKQSRSGCGQC